MHRLQDYLNRLSHAGPAEIIYRLKRRLLARRLEKQLSPENQGLFPPRISQRAIEGLVCPQILLAKERTVPFASPPDFREFEDRFRTCFFSRIVPGPNDPDIRWAWEAARLQPRLRSLATAPPGRDRMEAALEVVQWINTHPFLFGIHYISPMEMGLRMPVFFFALKTLDPQTHARESQILLSALFSNGWWISRNMALYSSLGNHTVCEAVGLLFCGAVFQSTPRGREWIKRACEILEQERGHQIRGDGGPGEQSFGYHRMVLDLFWLARDFLTANGLYNCRHWTGELERGEAFLAAVSPNGEEWAAVGDWDGGFALGPDILPIRGTGSGPQPDTDPISLRHPYPSTIITSLTTRSFPDSGYTCFRSGRTFMLFDHGQLGMAPLYNHGHADALSVLLYLNGLPFLVDPGTFQYNNVPEERVYFKGTRAHNTVCIDGGDQARQVSGFIWDTPFEIRNTHRAHHQGRITALASHTGYHRLKEPVTHIREIHWESDHVCWIIDRFKGEGCHCFELNFHLHPKVKLLPRSHGFILSRGNTALVIQSPSGCFNTHRSETSPLSGWVSQTYGHKEPTTTLCMEKTGPADDITFTTRLDLYVQPEIPISTPGLLNETLSHFEFVDRPLHHDLGSGQGG